MHQKAVHLVSSWFPFLLPPKEKRWPSLSKKQEQQKSFTWLPLSSPTSKRGKQVFPAKSFKLLCLNVLLVQMKML